MPASRQGRTFNRFGQIIISFGIVAFGAGMFYWLTTLQWQGIAAAFICLFTCIMMAGVVSMEVKDPAPPAPLPWMPPDDPQIEEGHPPPRALPSSQPSTPSTSDGYSPPPGSVPPDAHQKKDPFAI